MPKLIRAFAVFAAASALVALGLLVFDFFQTQERFPFQTFIGRLSVSNLTKDEAVQKIKALSAAKVYSALVTFEAEGKSFRFPPEEIGAYIKPEESVDNAFRLTHQDDYLTELRERIKYEYTAFPLMVGVEDRKLEEILKALGEELRVTPRDASFIFYEETGGYHIEKESVGRELDFEKTLADIKAGLKAGEASFALRFDHIYPRVTEEALRTHPPISRLSAYTTYYGTHDSPNRIHNIKLMASWMDNTLLMPEEEFSLVKAIGEFTPERGFKEAFVIYAGVLTPMLGGGGCQIGTTLYNTIALADLEILERKNHSFYFNIYPLGRDATIYPDQKDLRFRNNTGHPVLIKALATNKRLSFRLYGTPTGKKVLFSTPSVYLLTASGYAASTVRAVLEADAPFKTFVTRTVYDAQGNKIKEEVLSSFYKLYGEKTNVPIARPEPR